MLEFFPSRSCFHNITYDICPFPQNYVILHLTILQLWIDFNFFIFQGWKHAQIGPSLLDLQHITNTQLDEISAVFSADGVGYLLGSLLSGFLFQKFNSAILFIISSIVSAIITIVIPFCSIFEVMMAVFVLKGIFDSLVESGKSFLLQSDHSLKYLNSVTRHVRIN